MTGRQVFIVARTSKSAPTATNNGTYLPTRLCICICLFENSIRIIWVIISSSTANAIANANANANVDADATVSRKLSSILIVEGLTALPT